MWMAVFAAACTSDGKDGLDADGDGFPEEDDCDDGNPAINPSAEEVCDGADNDCDGTVDVDATDGITV